MNISDNEVDCKNNGFESNIITRLEVKFTISDLVIHVYINIVDHRSLYNYQYSFKVIRVYLTS